MSPDMNPTEHVRYGTLLAENLPMQSKMSKYWRIKNCYLTGVATIPPRTAYASCAVTPPPPKAIVPKMWLSWNEVFRWRQTLARPSVGRNKKRLSSDQWTRLHVRIVHPKWSCDQSNRAWRWRNVNCGRFMGRHARIPWWWRRLITVRVLMWPPNAKLWDCTSIILIIAQN
jgi:hypothetical protein